MLSSQIPVKMPTIWGSGADPGEITNPIPVAPQAGGRASFTIGWPDPTFQPLASGGNPPYGKDFNGIFNMITAWLQWAAAGGNVPYDATFQAAIGGYPKYALIQAATGDRYWLSDVDNNLTNPDTGGAGWHLFPDVIVQQQFGNYGQDIGSANAFRVTLSPKPASLAAIIGSPIRVRAASANTINTPTIAIDNTANNGPVSMINATGTVLAIGQISGAGCIFEGLYDGTMFRVLNPAPIQAIPPSSLPVVTGVIYTWSSEIVPTWGLECNGALVPITSFPNLFNVIQFRYGGDGVNNFRVPDLRGAFQRGWDHGRGLDPNATTRVGSPLFSAGVVGDHVGSWEFSALNGAQLQGAQFIMSGNPNFQEFGQPQPPISDPSLGTVYPIAYRNSKNIQTGGSTLPFGWENMLGRNDFGGVGPPQDSAAGAQSVLYEIAGVFSFISGPAAETRPINMDVMYVIAY